TKARDLFDSMYRGFPVGYLLFWANAVLPGARQIGVDGHSRPTPRLLIVDGQQRLTSLYAVIRAKTIVDSDYREQKLGIAFRPRDSTVAVADAAVRRDPEFVSDIFRLFSGGLFRVQKEFLEQLRGYREVSAAEEEELAEALNRVQDLQQYRFT